MKIEQIRENIIEYIKSFDQDDANIKLKYIHTLEVSAIMKKLATYMNLNDEEIMLAELIGLLHDVGRFEQIKQFNSMNDRNTLDHADYGVELLFKQGLIKKFLIPMEYYNVIEKAVRLHNKLKVDEPLTEYEEKFIKLIRDADKIDIYRVRAFEMKNIFYDEPTSKIIKDFHSEKTIDLTFKKTKSDAIICVMAFIYDINYKESFKMLKEKNYYNLFLKSIEIENDEEIIDIFNRLKEKALSYIERKLNS